MENKCKKVKTTSGVKCCVRGCDNRLSKNVYQCFHTFPKPGTYVFSKNIFGNMEKVDKLKAWKIALKMKTVLPDIRVCSSHFVKDDYILPDHTSLRKRLKVNAVPSCNLPVKSMSPSTKLRNKARKKKLKKSSALKNKSMEVEINPEEEQASHIDQATSAYFEAVTPDPNTVEIDMSLEEGASHADQVVSDYCSAIIEGVEPDSDAIENNATAENMHEQICTPTFNNVGIQVNSDVYVSYNILNLITSESELSTATGLESFALLDTIEEMVKCVYGNKLDNLILKTRDRIILTFIKLKQNLSYQFLALLFKCHSAKHVQTIFYETIKILSVVLKPMIYLPTREEISKNIPKCFEGFEDVRIVLDCTEIQIQRPANLCCQIQTYSHYKGHQTCKIMTGVTPAGNICFLSKVYSGKASDTKIFEQSELIDLLQVGDAVMVDRGFLIDSLCKSKGWKCIRPPFLNEKKQFSSEQATLTLKIAKARVHIERSNQRIKTFKIVGTTMPVQLVKIFEDIFTVICGTINLSAPISKNDKFVHE